MQAGVVTGPWYSLQAAELNALTPRAPQHQPAGWSAMHLLANRGNHVGGQRGRMAASLLTLRADPEACQFYTVRGQSHMAKQCGFQPDCCNGNAASSQIAAMANQCSLQWQSNAVYSQIALRGADGAEACHAVALGGRDEQPLGGERVGGLRV
jgi:hypothetical protein